jgi:hypothetical protein
MGAVVVCERCGHGAHPETPLECQWCPEGYCETHGLTDDQYAEIQAESLAAADLDPRWPADDT